MHLDELKDNLLATVREIVQTDEPDAVQVDRAIAMLSVLKQSLQRA